MCASTGSPVGMERVTLKSVTLSPAALGPAVLREKLASVPVVKSGLSLMTGTMVTSGLGLIFWILAARLYDAGDFGVSTTAVYTMMMLADVACLGLRTGLVRYLPKAGARTGGTILWGYGLVVAAAMVTAAVFLAGLQLWAPDLTEFRASGLLVIFFLASTAFWALFMLEDAVLVGLRRAPWVPIENSLFGVLKIALLFPFAAWSPTLGIFWAWTLPVFPIVIGVNVLVAGVARRRAEPNHPSHRSEPAELVDQPGTPGPAIADVEAAPVRSFLREILSFSLADWLAALARLVALGVIPLMVLAKLDTAQAGYFQASWLIAFTIMALSSNAAYALLAETSYEENKLHRNSFQAGVLSLSLTVPIIVVGALGAPLLLSIYGADYAANSSTVLRILLVAAVPNVIHQIFIGRLRSQGRMVGVVFFETALSVLVVSLAWVFLPRYGIDGVGLAWLLGLGALALYAMVTESQWWWAASLDTRMVRRVGAGFRRLRSDRPARDMVGRLEGALAAVGGVAGDRNAADVTWSGGGDETRAAVVPLADGRELTVEFARSEAGAGQLERRSRALRALGADPRLADLRPLLPELGAEDRTDGNRFLATIGPSGPTAAEAVRSGVPIDVVADLVSRAIEPLHRVTGVATTVDETMIADWTAESVSHLATTGRASAANIDRLNLVLGDALVGRSVEVGRIHGELALDNIVMSLDPPAVAGIGGWERSTEMPVAVDRATLAISHLALGANVELGSVVRSLLTDPAPFQNHPALVVGDAAISRPLLLLAWLNLVGRPLPPRRTMSSEVFWLARNAKPVLASLEPLVGSMR